MQRDEVITVLDDLVAQALLASGPAPHVLLVRGAPHTSRSSTESLTTTWKPRGSSSATARWQRSRTGFAHSTTRWRA